MVNRLPLLAALMASLTALAVTQASVADPSVGQWFDQEESQHTMASWRPRNGPQRGSGRRGVL